ncbi:universal stress protein [Noviherbaspirillum humi]|uniref:universal stress protein n=1 Tax=Noviherbaspirillum humi TaxID=1688639 RepID=UPI0015955261|nr:universal stress protein [Noviherbaspirillum humi]
MANILIPIDGSLSALGAVKQVIKNSAFQPQPTTVRLLNVQPVFSKHITRFLREREVHAFQTDRAERALAGAVGMLQQAGLPYSVHVRRGRIVEAILACCSETRCDRIVMGTAPKHALARWLQGSIINTVIARAHVPVEVVSTGEETLLDRIGVPVSIGAGLMVLVALSD